jgi:hypothetical protein
MARTEIRQLRVARHHVQPRDLNSIRLNKGVRVDLNRVAVLLAPESSPAPHGPERCAPTTRGISGLTNFSKKIL